MLKTPIALTLLCDQLYRRRTGHHGHFPQKRACTHEFCSGKPTKVRMGYFRLVYAKAHFNPLHDRPTLSTGSFCRVSKPPESLLSLRSASATFAPSSHDLSDDASVSALIVDLVEVPNPT